MALALSTAAAVRARIAQCWFAASTAERSLGRFTLRDTQRETVDRLVHLLLRRGGALLADPPGTGKTVVALAVASRLGALPLVAAPAAVRAHWLRVAREAGRQIEFVSIESLARGATPAPRPLLIVDEAHHLRTRSTARHARVAALASGARVLLLTATPVVNRSDDRDSLLSLFAESGHASADASELMVRGVRDQATGPAVARLPALHARADVPGLARALAALPPPLPAADGKTALPLVRLTLAMAWRSSLAALDATLRRRLQRGLSLADALAAGRWPSRDALRHWLIGDDATQLALDLVVDTTTAPPAGASAQLQQHLSALRTLRALIAPCIEPDARARAAAIRALSEAHDGVRVAVFAQYAATVRALWRVLRHSAGVVAITGDRVHAAAGRWSRDEVLVALGPGAAPFERDDPRAIRILLTTDLLSEGVELQGVGIVVHGDAPWTPARIEQRVGRAARTGNPAAVVRVTHFAPPRGAQQILALADRLAEKRESIARTLRAPALRQRLSVLIGAWRRSEEHAPPIPIATSVRCRAPMFLAALSPAPRGGALIVGRRVRGRWRLSQQTAELVHAVEQANGQESPADPVLATQASVLVEHWIEAQQARAALGRASADVAPHWRRLHRRVERALERATLVEREPLSVECGRALRALAAARGVGARQRVDALMKTTPSDRDLISALVRLAAEWRELTELEPATHEGPAEARPRLVALLLLTTESSGPRDEARR